MIEKIIANGQPGAAAAALDVAIKLGLTHGGWYGDGNAIPSRYHLEQITGAPSQRVIDRSIGAADGSLCFIQGEKADLELEKTKKAALRMNKPFLVVDINRESGFSASRRIAAWIIENRIRVLHVDGCDDGQAAASMANSVAGILEATLFLSMMETGITSPLQSIVQRERSAIRETPPQTMQAALDHLERSLSLKDKATIANMAAEELVSLHFTLGSYINTHFDLFTTNSELLSDCQRHSGRRELASKDVAAVIIRLLWERLRSTCRIRIIK